MTNVNKTVAERLREYAKVRETEDYALNCSLSELLELGCDPFSHCGDCESAAFKKLADMIETEQAELRNQTIDLAALDLLCDKLECGDANHRATAEQIRKAMNGAERAKAEYDGVDVDALLKLADHLNKRTSYDPKGDNLLADTIRNAVNGAKPQLPEGIEWPRFEDGELVKIGDEFLNNKGNTATVTRIALSEKHFTINKGQGRICKTYGNRIKRPEPEVLDADGVPIKVGDTVWNISTGKKYEVLKLPRKGSYQSVMVRGEDGADGFDPDRLTHRKPDTLESVVTEMLAEWDENSEEFLNMDSYFARFRKLMGGE